MRKGKTKAKPKPKARYVTFLGERCKVEFHEYQNGRVAIRLTAGGYPMATATVNLPELPLGEGEAFIKDYSENVGILGALVDAGIVEDTGRRVQGGFATFPVVKVLR